MRRICRRGAHMKMTTLCVAMLAAGLMSLPAAADELSDLKAEIAAQKQAAAAQKARLDALEEKLNSVQQQQQSAAAQQPAASADGKSALPSGVAFKQGEGLSYSTASGSVTLYGLIDVTYVHVNNANANGDNLTSPRVSWFSGNRWGVTGTH